MTSKLFRITPRAKVGAVVLSVLLSYIGVEEIKALMYCQEYVIGEGDYSIRHVVRYDNGSVEYPLANKCPICNE